MSDYVQLEEKQSGKSKQSSRHTKKSNNKSQNNENKDNESQNNNQEVNNTETENKQPSSSPPPQQVISTRAYLEQNVTPVVQEALLECARKRPDNPLEFVGNYILNRAHGK